MGIKKSIARSILAINTNPPLNDLEARRRKFMGSNIARFMLVTQIALFALAIYLTHLCYLWIHQTQGWTYINVLIWCASPILMLFIWRVWFKLAKWHNNTLGQLGIAYTNSGRGYFGEKLLFQKGNEDTQGVDVPAHRQRLNELNIKRPQNK